MIMCKYEYESSMWFVTYGCVLKLITALISESQNL